MWGTHTTFCAHNFQEGLQSIGAWEASSLGKQANCIVFLLKIGQMPICQALYMHEGSNPHRSPKGRWYIHHTHPSHRRLSAHFYRGCYSERMSSRSWAVYPHVNMGQFQHIFERQKKKWRLRAGTLEPNH